MFWFFGCVLWDLSSPTRDQTCTPFVGGQSFNYWTVREVRGWALIIKKKHWLVISN